MAGDWIKFESATPDKPEIWSIADSLDVDPDAVVGKLLRVWIWFDSHTESGNAPSVTKKLLDRLVGVNGFCDCVILAGWMTQNNDEIHLPNFERHNGNTAKNRALTAKRVAKHKEKQTHSKANAKGNAPIVNSALPKEEKRREDKRTITQRADALDCFDKFWSVYDKKQDRAKCEKKWKKLKSSEKQKIFEVLSDYIKSTPDKQFRKNPLTWLNGQCWNDEIQSDEPEKTDFEKAVQKGKELGIEWQGHGVHTPEQFMEAVRNAVQ